MKIVKKIYKEDEDPKTGQQGVVSWSSRALLALTTAVFNLVEENKDKILRELKRDL